MYRKMFLNAKLWNLSVKRRFEVSRFLQFVVYWLQITSFLCPDVKIIKLCQLPVWKMSVFFMVKNICKKHGTELRPY